ERDVLTRLLAAKPQDTRASVMLADVTLRGGDVETAREILTRLSAGPGATAGALALLGRLHLQEGQPALAASAFDRARQRRPVDGTLLLETARAHRLAGDYWTALERLDEHVSLFGRTAASDFAIGAVYQDSGRWDMAREFYERAAAE